MLNNADCELLSLMQFFHWKRLFPLYPICAIFLERRCLVPIMTMFKKTTSNPHFLCKWYVPTSLAVCRMSIQFFSYKARLRSGMSVPQCAKTPDGMLSISWSHSLEFRQDKLTSVWFYLCTHNCTSHSAVVRRPMSLMCILHSEHECPKRGADQTRQDHFFKTTNKST